MSSKYREIRDKTAQLMADDKPQRDLLRCAADGCPLRWSCNMGKGKLCSWHDVAPKHDWPTVTAELQATLVGGKTPVQPVLKRAAWVVEAAAKAKAAREGRADAGASLFAQAMPKVQRRPNRERIREYALELGIDVEDDEPQEATRAHQIAPGSIAAKEVA